MFIMVCYIHKSLNCLSTDRTQLVVFIIEIVISIPLYSYYLSSIVIKLNVHSCINRCNGYETKCKNR